MSERSGAAAPGPERSGGKASHGGAAKRASHQTGNSRALGFVARHAIAIALAVMFLAPVVTLGLTSLMSSNQALTADLVPREWHFDNYVQVFQRTQLPRYLLNTVMLVTLILAAQFVLCTLAAFAFARLSFPGRDLLFAVVLLQLMVMPDVLLVENYRTLVKLHLADTILAIALPYLGSAFGIFLLRQTFLTIPQPLDDAARLEGCGLLARLWRVYVPLAKPTYIAYGLVSVSYHWNNFLWPLVITNSVTTRPLTVGLAIFATTDQGIDWSIVTAATLMTSAPLLVAFLLFQRQFVQSFMRAGIR